MAQKTMTYQEAVDNIEDILQKIEHEELDVDDLTDKVKQVSKLIEICKKKLHNTEAEVEKILATMETGTNSQEEE
jgi:exodeoxyribonuclease VII small subunit